MEIKGEYIYQGHFLDDKFYGKGKKIFFDGRIFEGEFKNGKEEGFGCFYDKNGKVFQKGIWIDGEFAN